MKKKKSGSLISGIIVLIMAIAFLAYAFVEYKGLFKDAVELDKALDKDITVGTKVTVGVDAVVDWYAVLEHKSYGIKTSEDNYCMIWLDDGTFIGLKVHGDKDKDKIEKIIDSTYNYLDGKEELANKVKFTGILSKMQGEERQYFESLLSDMGYEEDEWDEYARFYTIDTTETITSFLIIVVIAVIFIFVGLANIIMFVKGKKKVNSQTPYNLNGSFQQGSSTDNMYNSGIYNPNTYNSNNGQNTYAPNTYGQDPYGQDPYGQSTSTQNAYNPQQPYIPTQENPEAASHDKYKLKDE